MRKRKQIEQTLRAKSACFARPTSGSAVPGEKTTSARAMGPRGKKTPKTGRRAVDISSRRLHKRKETRLTRRPRCAGDVSGRAGEGAGGGGKQPGPAGVPEAAPRAAAGPARPKGASP